METTRRSTGDKTVTGGIAIWIPVLATALGAILGFIFSVSMAGISQGNVNRNRLLDARLACYDSLRIPINEIYCYTMYVGHWKDRRPEDIVAAKRRADELAYTYMPIWNKNFSQRYREFMHATFAFTANGGGEVKIIGPANADSLHYLGYLISHPRLSDQGKQKLDPRVLQVLWSGYFVPREEARDNRDSVYMAYVRLMKEVSAELGGKATYSEATPKYLPAPELLQLGAERAQERVKLEKELEKAESLANQDGANSSPRDSATQ